MELGNTFSKLQECVLDLGNGVSTLRKCVSLERNAFPSVRKCVLDLRNVFPKLRKCFPDERTNFSSFLFALQLLADKCRKVLVYKNKKEKNFSFSSVAGMGLEPMTFGL